MNRAQTSTTVEAGIATPVFVIGGLRVLLDSDLAALYGVTTKALNQAVRRNIARFPEDFIKTLSHQEVASLRSQIVTLKSGRGSHRKYAPLVFTEHGAIMAATVLNSSRAIQMTVYVVRAFVRARELTSSHSGLARELHLLKQSVAALDAQTRRQFDVVYEAILSLVNHRSGRQ